ncbi:MAG: FlgD immunoglobulin-like domain containing protein, partial [Candidatus Krumholzibacteriia bacterium]
DPELLVLPAGGEYFAYGIARPDSLPLLGSVAIATPAGPPVTLGVACGRRVVVADADGGTFVLDFADPAHPVARPGPALPAVPRISVFRDDRAVLLYESAWQLAAVTAAGDFVLLSDALPVPTTRYLSALWEGDVVCCATATAVHAYAAADPDAPEFLGQVMIAGGSLGMQAGRLVAGRHVYPPPCDVPTSVRVRHVELHLVRGDPCAAPPGRCELAVLTTSDFDAGSIVAASVTLGEAGVRPEAWARADADADGDLDLVLVLGIAPGAGAGLCTDGRIELVARLADGTLVRGSTAAGGIAPALGFGPAGLVVRLAPNPFNPRLTVDFVQERAGPVRATVHDLRGRRLAVLVDGHRESGSHEIAWDGRDERGRAAAAGTYVVRFATDRGLQAVKAVLLR